MNELQFLLCQLNLAFQGGVGQSCHLTRKLSGSQNPRVASPPPGDHVSSQSASQSFSWRESGDLLEFQHGTVLEGTVSCFLPVLHAYQHLLGETTLVEQAPSPASPSRGTRPAPPPAFPRRRRYFLKGRGPPEVLALWGGGKAFPSPVSWRPPTQKACRRLRTGRDRSSGTGS